MKKTFRVIAVLAGLASATAFGSNFAQAEVVKKCCQECAEHGHHGHPFMHKRFERMAAKLGLSEQQKVKIREIFKENRAQAKPIFDRLITERRDLRTLVQADKTDEAAIRAQAAQLAAVEGDLAIQRAHMVKQIRAILTPEQVEKFKAMQKERDQRIGKFHGRHGQLSDKSEAEK